MAQERTRLLVGLRRRGDGNVQAPDRLNAVVVDLREDDLLLDPERVVATPVERIRVSMSATGSVSIFPPEKCELGGIIVGLKSAESLPLDVVLDIRHRMHYRTSSSLTMNPSPPKAEP